MQTMLAENIRKFRKERSLTQEQLAEVLGVTTGAVYKWEARLSVPDLDLIMEMADFFDTSVDVLLGYEMKDNHLEATVKRLQEYRRKKDAEGLSEALSAAEKALKKYPHSFRIVNESASLYYIFGVESKNRKYFLRALELLEQSRLLLSQNTDPEISEQTLCGKMGEIYLGLNEEEKGIELLKKYNSGGLYDHKIGHILAECGRPEEAAPFLSKAMAWIIADLIDTVIGYMLVYLSRGDHTSAQAILQLGIGFFGGLRKENRPNILDKIDCALLTALAYSQFASGCEEAARASLQEAQALAAFFDQAPSYDESDIRFIDRIEGASAHDDLGATAAEAVDNVVKQFENEAFSAFWKSVSGQGEQTNTTEEE